MIQGLRDEIKMREREMREAQSRMIIQINRLEKENFTLKKLKGPEVVPTTKTTKVVAATVPNKNTIA
jgi:predicted MarR family transcription regulator